MAYHVSKQRFAKLVEEALEGLPQPFAQHLEEVSVEIKDRPTAKQLKGAGLEEDELLLGLYVGHPMTQRSVEHSGTLPDVIFIFQEDIELVSESEEELVEQVRITVLHEIGHHFGMGEEDLEDLGYG
ncbi:MAG TPA: metallopeptidase family protein [Tepidisphaeraceae bacterium]|nr:metallopeptidase family protein [Tepidisphaeraceae bacterium]